MSAPTVLLVWVLAALGALPARADAVVDPAELIAQVRQPRLDPSGAVSLRDLEIDLGPAVFHVGSGFVFPARMADGRPIEWVFIGQATFRLDPPDEIEAGQLELFTGERVLAAPVEEAVFVLTEAAVPREFSAGPKPRELRPEQRTRAEALYRSWLAGPERRSAGVEAAVFGSLAGDAALSSYVALWCRSFELGEFMYRIDPENEESVTLGSFHGLTLSGWERARLKHLIRAQQRKGRFLDTRIEDLGAWDVWVSAPARPSAGAGSSGALGFEAEHYELDTTLAPHGLVLDGRARLRLRAEASGRRVVRLDLARDLRVLGVADAAGRELFFTRSGGKTLVLLPEPSRAGESLTLDVRWGGRALSWIDGRYHELEDTRTWHPHCGTADRATYDVTLRWPAKYEILAGGRLVDSGHEGPYRFERRRLDLPAVGFSFAIGRFAVERVRVGHVDLTVGFHESSASRASADLRRRTVDTVAAALQYFEGLFGRYPLDELTVVTVPRSFSQSYLGFAVLGERLVMRAEPLGPAEQWFRNMTVAHEIAHQWWGNLVGWKSYRDQWLSEGMANYAALLFDGHVSGDPAGRLAALSAGWRDALAQGTPSGRTIESFGPVVLGNRLNSSVAPDGYRPIVYRKGAVILAMLARAVGERAFLDALRSILDAPANQIVTTDAFLATVERMSGTDLDGFARQFVYGTGIPEVYYGYDARPAGDGWTVEGEARFLESPLWHFQIARIDDGRFEVRRQARPLSEEGPTGVVVPYTVTLDPPEAAAAGATSERRRQTGQLALDGRHQQFEIKTEFQPVDLQLDPRGELLAWFYSAKSERKRVLRYQAEDRLARGRLEEAADLYREVLTTPVETPGDTEDLRSRLGLVRVSLAQGHVGEAQTALDAIDAGLENSERASFPVERDVLRARIELSCGESAAALKRLKRTLRRVSRPGPAMSPDPVAGPRPGPERAATAEAWALSAVAASAAGRERDLLSALREARARGVDVGAFARILPR